MSKAKILTLEVSPNCNYNICGYEVAKVEISKGYAIRLLARINMLKKMKKIDSDLYEMYYWDGSVQYFESQDSKEEGPTECDQCIVREKEVQWCAYPKHSEGVEIRTAYVRIEDIEKVAKG